MENRADDASEMSDITHYTSNMTLALFCAMTLQFSPVVAEAAKASVQRESETAPALTPATDVNQEVSTFQLSGYRENGQKKWEIAGDTANIMADTVEMTNIVAHSYGPQTTVKLTADNGRLNRTTQDVHLENHVVAVTDDGARMRTHELDWHQNEEKVTTPSDVWVARENIEVTGTGAVAQPNLKRVQLAKNITVVMTPKERPAGRGEARKTANDPLAALAGGQPAGPDQKTTITCSGPLEVDYEQNVAIFRDDVHVTDHQGEIFSDLLTVYVDPKTKQIQKAIAQHHVRIVRGDNTAFCEEATYDPTAGRVTLVGAPRLVVHPVAGEDEFGPPAAKKAKAKEAQASSAAP